MMKCLLQIIIVATVLTAAAAVTNDKLGGRDDGGLRRKRNIKKNTNKNSLRNEKKNTGGLDEEDVTFWTRLMQQNGSLPTPPPPTPRPVPPTPFTPIPTDSGPFTPSPVAAVTTPSPTTSCGISPAARRAQITSALSQISTPALFNQDTPQRDALNWIIDDDASQLCPDDESLVQRYTLAVFYFSTNGDGWKQCNAPANFNQASIAAANAACTLTTVNATTIFPNDVRGTNAWLTPDSECLWGGVSCYATSSSNSMKVNVIEFENNDLGGTLPTEMKELDSMRFFALERGNIGGTIPSSYGNLKSLLLLDFDFNKLTGTLPSSLWSLSALRQLDLNDNNFAGTLSEDIGNLDQLRFFQIDNNMMTGPIPNALGDIPNFSEYNSYHVYIHIYRCISFIMFSSNSNTLMHMITFDTIRFDRPIRKRLRRSHAPERL